MAGRLKVRHTNPNSVHSIATAHIDELRGSTTQAGDNASVRSVGMYSTHYLGGIRRAARSVVRRSLRGGWMR